MVQPYNKSKSKKSEVRAMFNNIARNYDFLNHFFSLGIDVIWRKRVIRELSKYNPNLILDMATGTGDLAITAAQKLKKQIIGVDLSSEMIAVGNKKIAKKNLSQLIQLQVGDAEVIEFNDSTFDAVMVAFGVRNFENLELGLREIQRVLGENKPLLVLEFSKPTIFPVKQFFHFYSFNLLPFIGRLVSKDPRAYTYLPESIMAFPSGDEFITVMKNCGFSESRQIPLSGRIATLYIGEKK
ncbi:MAG: bifunctional demethylmenaquinone methyltransferase/2-methoxy-6-polyprenyl-1,4-benzoquinol methylase UbiE [Prolixibacteraceae bacterium]|nr:bifunctional demethylmenaquinone methyltransferase/2-methoxy-6-polyprenyl-1,4-benzoquinol methylase UbiE [Prolixibacteraceae bacterium]